MDGADWETGPWPFQPGERHALSQTPALLLDFQPPWGSAFSRSMPSASHRRGSHDDGADVGSTRCELLERAA